jgi:hypothetical protein
VREGGRKGGREGGRFRVLHTLSERHSALSWKGIGGEKIHRSRQGGRERGREGGREGLSEDQPMQDPPHSPMMTAFFRVGMMKPYIFSQTWR